MNGERRETRVKRGNERKYRRENYFSSSFSLLSPIHPHPRVCPPARVYVCVCMRPPGEKVKPGVFGGLSPCPSGTYACAHHSQSEVKGWGNGLSIDGSAVFRGTSNGSSAGKNAPRRARERSPCSSQFVLPVRFFGKGRDGVRTGATRSWRSRKRPPRRKGRALAHRGANGAQPLGDCAPECRGGARHGRAGQGAPCQGKDGVRRVSAKPGINPNGRRRRHED